MKKKRRFIKFLKVKITILSALFVLVVLGLQTPWVKNWITFKLTETLSEATHSQVTITKSKGFVPFDFEIQNIEFNYQGKTWLKVERLNLNQSLLYFIISKNKGLDLSLENVSLYFLPDFEPSTQTVDWPKLPFYNLNVEVVAKNVFVDPAVFDQKLPPKIQLKSKVNFLNHGDKIYATATLTSDTLKQVEMHLKANANHSRDRFSAQLDIQDPSHELVSYFTDNQTPSINAHFKAKGSMEALGCFFDSNKKTDKQFEGSLNVVAKPTSEDSKIWQSILNHHALAIEGHFSFSSKEGLSLDHLHAFGALLNFKGKGVLNRNYQLENTSLAGHLNDLDFLKIWLKDPIEGEAECNAIFKGDLFNPEMKLELESAKLCYDRFIAYGVKSQLSFFLDQDQYIGQIIVSAEFNHAPVEINTLYRFKNLHNYDFKDFELKCGQNTIKTSFFQAHQDLYQGKLNCHLPNLAFLSPLFKQEIHGDVEGEMIFDLGTSSLGLEQKIDTRLYGSYLRIPLLHSDAFTLEVKGKVDWNHLEKFQGDFFASSQLLRYHNYRFDQVQALIQSKNYQYNFKVQTQGDLTLQSAGLATYQNDFWSLNLRLFTGLLYNESFSLLSPIQMQFKPEYFTFSPLALQLGAGRVFIHQKITDSTFTAQIHRFPLTSLSYFFPLLDLRGYVDLNGELNHISTHAQGTLSAKFYQLKVEEYQSPYPYSGQLEVTLNKKSIKGEFDLTENHGSDAKIKFDIPFDLSFFPLKYDVKLASSSMVDVFYQGQINPFIQLAIPQKHLISGDATVDLKLHGALQHPHIQGTVALKNGYYENLYLGLVLNNLDFQAHSSGDHLVLDHFKADDGNDGKISALGDVHFNFKKGMPYNLTVDLEEGQLVQFDFLSASLLGQVKFTGNLEQAHVSGDLKVTKANVTIPARLNSNIPILPVTYVYPRQDTNCSPTIVQELTWPIYFDVHLDVSDQTLINGRGLDSSWGGKLHISGTDIQPIFKGSLTCQEGTFDFAGRLFHMHSGIINFDGDILKGTSVNLLANLEIDQYLVSASLKGPLNGPYLTFKSEPNLTKGEILSLVLFDQMPKKLTPFQALSLTHTLATLSGVYLGPDVVDRVRKGIGLSQLTFGSVTYTDAVTKEEKDSTTIQAGKYISRNILITLNRPISPGPAPFIVTAHFKGGFQFQTYFDEQELAKLQIQWRLSY